MATHGSTGEGDEDRIPSSVIGVQTYETILRGLIIATIPPAPEAYKRVVEANFRVAAPWSGGETISAATNGTPFERYVTPGAYSAGTLQVVAESDGSSLVLDAGSGDPETVSVTVTEGDGTSGFLLEWSVIGDLPCLAPLEAAPYTADCRTEL